MRDDISTPAIGWLIGVTMAGATMVPGPLLHAGLYECRDSSGTLIYTDSPAQLDRCQPIASGGTSRLGLVGGTSISAPPAPEPVSSLPAPIAPLPATEPGAAGIPPAMPAGGLAPSGGSPVGLAGRSTDTPPCIPGMNPLNPLSAPPCDTAPPPVPQPPPSFPGNP